MSLHRLKVAIFLLLAASSQAGAQTCQSEVAVPSSTPNSRFQDNGDATITDKATGLMWAKCAEGLFGSDCAAGSVTSYTWEGALSRARDSAHAGYNDWRLPSIKELYSLIEERCYNPSVNLDVFPNEPGLDYWSASPTSSNSTYAWYVHFSTAGVDVYPRTRSLLGVRLVRSGQ